MKAILTAATAVVLLLSTGSLSHAQSTPAGGCITAGAGAGQKAAEGDGGIGARGQTAGAGQKAAEGDGGIGARGQTAGAGQKAAEGDGGIGARGQTAASGMPCK